MGKHLGGPLASFTPFTKTNFAKEQDPLRRLGEPSFLFAANAHLLRPVVLVIDIKGRENPMACHPLLQEGCGPADRAQICSEVQF